MQIERIFYPVKTLGFGNRIGIWTLGCEKKCKNCSNPELQPFNIEKDKKIEEVFKVFEMTKELVSNKGFVVDGVTITGGEPFLQKEELRELIIYINKNLTEDVLIYTGFTLDELKAKKDPCIDEILANISVLIDGEYIEELNDNKNLRGSSNQRIHFLKSEYKPKYELLLKGERKTTVVLADKEMVAIGIPKANYRQGIIEKFDLQGIVVED